MMYESNSELYYKLSRLQWLLHKQQIRSYALGGPMADPTRGQGRILAILNMQDGVSTKDLSYLLGIRVSSLNELLAKLEKGGYITREPSEDDKRVILVKLTDKGREQKQQGVQFGDIFSCLSEEEQAAFGGYLDRVIAALETEVGGEPDDMYDRMKEARERMGEEVFERFGQPFRGPFEGFGPFCGMGGHWHEHGQRHGGGKEYRRMRRDDDEI